jgi:Ni,Fe-hydrogenase III large subunit
MNKKAKHCLAFLMVIQRVANIDCDRKTQYNRVLQVPCLVLVELV